MILKNEQIIGIQREIDLGNVNKTKHPELDLFVLCYSKSCHEWNEITSICRGMVVDQDWNIIAQVMKKFRNDFELERENIKPPQLPFQILEKVDGSLIHIFNYKNEWMFTSKGSFISEQAVEAKKIFEESFQYSSLTAGWTYALEIRYPENRIVVDYGNIRDLTLLTIFDENGLEIDTENQPFNKVKQYDSMDISEIKAKFNHLKGDEAEGFVLRYENGFRMKIKLDSYFLYHRIISGLSERSIWELLSTGQSLELLYSTQDEEIGNWITKTSESLKSKYEAIENECSSVYLKLNAESETQKDYALMVMSNPCIHKGILFNFRSGKDYSGQIWKAIYPAAGKSFKVVIDE